MVTASWVVADAQAASTWYVAPGGSDANTCAVPGQPCATINGSIGKASAGDTVEVATGTYTGVADEVVLVDRDLSLEGGWNAGFTTQTGLATVDAAGGARRGVRIVGADVRIERFEIKNGVATFLQGGGIFASGTGARLELDGSIVRDSMPGGIWADVPVVVTNSTIAENSSNSSGAGGGITAAWGAPLTIANSTISGNINAGDAGGIYLQAPLTTQSSVQLSNVTITGNTAGGGSGGGVVVGHGVTLHLRNSIVAGNGAAIGRPDIAVEPPDGAVVSDGYNLGTGFTATTGDVITAVPLLAALADNGGPTPTRALLPGSPAVDAGNPDGCVDEDDVEIDLDQRGVPRPLGYACEIGAYEAEPPANDDLADGTSLDGLTGPLLGSNAFATKELGEPDHALIEGGASIWYRWMPGFTGTAFVSTQGSKIDSLLGIYTGAAVSSLVQTAENDDAYLSTGQSKACFPVSAGSTYRIAVDGFDAGTVGTQDEGDVTLDWGQYTSSDPCSQLPPTISGTAKVGEPLVTTTGTWAGTPAGFAYQWAACDYSGCYAIPAANAAVYTPSAPFEGFALFVRVTAKHLSDPSLDAISYSDLTDVVAAGSPPPQPTPPQPPPPRPPPPQPLPPQPPPPHPPPRQSACVVPKVKGKTLARARRMIAAAHCRVGRVSRRCSQAVKSGRVMAQTPAAGKRRPSGAKVSLVVSRGRRR